MKESPIPDRRRKAFKSRKSLNFLVSININREGEKKGASRKDGYERLRPKFTSY